jgi:hypothetical protein
MSLEDLTTDQLLARARELESSHNVLQTLSTNPKTRETIQRALKTLKPDLVIPEIDAKDSLRGEIQTEREARQTLERSIQERDIRERLEKQRAAIQKQYKLTEADLPGVEALMIDKDNPIPTYDAAARVYLASRQSATPTPASFSAPTYDMPEKDIWGKGIGNRAMLDKIAIGQAFEAWNELQTGKVPGLGAAR